jgi:hypothetical protein
MNNNVILQPCKESPLYLTFERKKIKKEILHFVQDDDESSTNVILKPVKNLHSLSHLFTFSLFKEKSFGLRPRDDNQGKACKNFYNTLSSLEECT